MGRLTVSDAESKSGPRYSEEGGGGAMIDVCLAVLVVE